MDEINKDKKGIPSPFSIPELSTVEKIASFEKVEDLNQDDTVQAIKLILGCTKFVIAYNVSGSMLNAMIVQGFSPDEIDLIGVMFKEVAERMRKMEPPKEQSNG